MEDKNIIKKLEQRIIDLNNLLEEGKEIVLKCNGKEVNYKEVIDGK